MKHYQRSVGSGILRASFSSASIDSKRARIFKLVSLLDSSSDFRESTSSNNVSNLVLGRFILVAEKARSLKFSKNIKTRVPARKPAQKINATTTKGRLNIQTPSEKLNKRDYSERGGLW